MNGTCQRTVNCVSGCVLRADSLVRSNYALAIYSPYRVCSLPMLFLGIVRSGRRVGRKEEREMERSEKERCETKRLKEGERWAEKKKEREKKVSVCD